MAQGNLLTAFPLGPSCWPFAQTPDGQAFPMLPIQIVSHGAVEAHGLIDTGAPRTVIPTRHARALGVELALMDGRLLAIGGVARGYYVTPTPLHIEIAGQIIRLDSAMFSDHHPDVIVGRDVLAHFRLVFDERAGELILDPHPEG